MMHYKDVKPNQCMYPINWDDTDNSRCGEPAVYNKIGVSGVQMCEKHAQEETVHRLESYKKAVSELTKEEFFKRIFVKILPTPLDDVTIKIPSGAQGPDMWLAERK